MFSKSPLFLFSLASFFACQYNVDAKNDTGPVIFTVKNDSASYSRVNGIPLPTGYIRKKYDTSSFAHWLQNVRVKKDKTVYLYDGRKKANQEAQYAVLDISVSKKDLQQCADAVMRLRAEYLFAEKDYQNIVFKDNEAGIYAFSAPYTRLHFDAYLERVFGMCGSASLSKQLHAVKKFDDIEAGDVIIRGGFPGHAVIVMDVATNAKGKKIYLLAQSYMPAQDIHLLVNSNNANFSPWYEIDNDEKIITPEYVFSKSELKRW